MKKGNIDEARIELLKIKKSDTLYSKARKIIRTFDSVNYYKAEYEFYLTGNLNKSKKLLVKIDSSSQYYLKRVELESKFDRKLKEIKRYNDIKKTEELKQKEYDVYKNTALGGLEVAIKEIENGINYSEYRGSLSNLRSEIYLFNYWSRLINAGINSENFKIKELALKLKKYAISIQKKEFPIVRKEFGKLLNKELWIVDIAVNTSGNGNVFLNISGGVFAVNKNIQEFNDKIHSDFKQYRFKNVRYRWYEGASSYTYYVVYEGNDSDLD